MVLYYPDGTPMLGSHQNWASRTRGVEPGISPPASTNRVVASWQSQDGNPYPMQVTVQRTPLFGDTGDAYGGSPRVVVEWGARDAVFATEIDAAAGNSMTLTAQSVSVRLTVGTVDESGLYSVLISPQDGGQRLATRTVFTGAIPLGVIAVIEVPPFAHTVQFFRTPNGTGIPLGLWNYQGALVGDLFLPGGVTPGPFNLSSHIRRFETDGTAFGNMVVIFHVGA